MSYRNIKTVRVRKWHVCLHTAVCAWYCDCVVAMVVVVLAVGQVVPVLWRCCGGGGAGRGVWEVVLVSWCVPQCVVLGRRHCWLMDQMQYPGESPAPSSRVERQSLPV